MAFPPLDPGTSIIYRWKILLFNFDGSTADSVDYTGYSISETTNEILHASNRSLNFYLNGVDDCSFLVYLDDPIASHIVPTKSVVKIYRTVYEADGTTVIYQDEDTFPCFAGVVQSTVKDGDANTMTVTAYSPLWRLQSRFHVHNHYLEIDQNTSEPYTGSGVIFKLIDLINSAFPATGDAYTGIEQGTANWVDEPHMAPYFVAKGSVTWSLIFDDIMSRPAAADIIPTYNDDTTNIMMILDTDETRGTDISSFISFNYHTGSNDNCDNMTEELAAAPGTFANFLWAVGQGGPNSGKVAVAWDNDSGDFDSNTIGLYMKVLDKSDIKRVTALTPIAEAELKQSRWPDNAYTVNLSSYGGMIYKYNFDVGDVVNLSANKGALQIGKPQRIYQVGLTMSDNNVELASPLVSNDFYGKVGPGGGTVITDPSALTADFVYG